MNDDFKVFENAMIPKPTPEQRQSLYIKKSRESTKSRKGYKTRDNKRNSTWLRQSHQFIFGADIRDDELIASKLRLYLEEHYPVKS